MIAKIGAAFLCLTLSAWPAFAQYRIALSGDTVFYFKNSSTDTPGNDCRNAAAPCKTCTFAAKSASRFDTMAYAVTIQFLDEDDGLPVVLGNCWIPTMIGGGTLRILGSPVIGNTIFDAKDANGNGIDDITLFDTHVSVFIDQMTLRGGGGGMVSVDYLSRLTVGSYVYWGEGRKNAQGAHDNSHIYVHDSLAQVLLFNAPKVTGSASAHISINGSQVFVEGEVVTFQNSPSFDCVYVVMNNGSMQHISDFYAGAINGKTYCLSNGGTLNTFGAPISITGASAGTNNGGHYQP